jgi:hypothetical protein
MSKAMSKSVQKRIAAQNNKFGGMTPAQQRVAIASDALAWLAAGALVAEQGTYVTRVADPDQWNNDIDAIAQLRDQQLGPCSVCGLGALFLAKAVRFDDVTGEDFLTLRREVVGVKLGNHFSAVQLTLIESAFEMMDLQCEPGLLAYEDLRPAIEFGSMHEDDGVRLKAILENIIENRGEFRP